MTEGDIYWSLRGREYQLGPLVEGGGDGVYSLPLARQIVARIYAEDADLDLCERKVQAMLKRPPALPDIVEDGERFAQIAWPVASLHDKQSRFVGFLMPTVDLQTTTQLESVLQERQARAEGLPSGLGAKMNLAARLAVAVNELHDKGHRAVYLTPANLRFHRQSLHMAVVGCEHFSLRADNERFAADLDAAGRNAAHYLAPEFQNQPISRDQEESQDRFALAVLVFQLLNFGIHPFTGTPTNDQVPTDIPSRIAGNCYAYGSIPNPDIEPSPGSGHLAMPKELKSLFDRAFAGKPSARPQAQEWATWLQFYAIPSNDWVVVCSANSRHQHFVNLPCAACARAPLLPPDQADIPPEDDPVDPVKSTVARYVQPERASPPARRPRPARLPAQPAQRWTPPTLLSVFHVVAALTVVAFAVRFSLAFMNSLTPNSESNSVHELVPEPADSRAVPATPTGPLADPYLAGSSAMEQEEALTDGYVTTAALAIATGDRPGWQRAITNLHTNSPDHAPPSPSEFQAAFASFSGSLSPDNFNEGRLQWLLNKLQQVLRKNPYDDESAYELGWLSLADGKRDEARSLFLHAIWVNPDRATAWYGLGVIGAGDNQKTGALTTAELLTTDPAQTDSLRKAFPALLLRLSSVKPDDFAGLQAKAQQMADQYRPLIAAPVIASPASNAAASAK